MEGFPLPPEVSVVIPTYNRPGLLQRAVRSAVAQDGVHAEIIVVDDGSAPCVSADAMPPSVILARTGSQGVAAARNLGAEVASAPWIAFLDDDDWWAPDHLRRLLSAATAADAGFAYTGRWHVDLSTGAATLRPALHSDGLATRLLHENVVGTPSGVIVRRSLYLEVGGSDSSLAAMADWDLWIRLAGVARGVADPVATVAYAVHEDNMSSDVQRLISEFPYLAERHAAACARHGIKFGESSFPRWIARLYRDDGRRIRAAAWYLRSARVPGRRLDALRAIGVLLGERAMLRGSGTLTTPRAPSGPVPAWVVPGKTKEPTAAAHWSDC
jgi:glycosyltransferase involved in cell wall biosynthesis